MRKCRNWQTSKTKDLVHIACVWVQVPSSAVRKKVQPKGWTFFRTAEDKNQESENTQATLARGASAVQWTASYEPTEPAGENQVPSSARV